MTPHLIQRGSFLNRENKKGIDSILIFDYMGSSEFEWGALPESLKEIRNNINDFRFHHLLINEKKVTVYVNKSESITDLIEYLNNLAKRKCKPREYSDFETYIFPDKDELLDENQTDFWWDIGNHFMFWKGNTAFTAKFKEVIK